MSRAAVVVALALAGCDTSPSIGEPLPTRVAGVAGAVSIAPSFWSTACAVTGDGAAYCWESQGLEAERVAELLPASALALHQVHRCAVARDGSAWCWGDNRFGQLGSDDLDEHREPTRVVDLEDVRDVSVGDDHTCAVTGDHLAWCWGGNSNGQLGDGTGGDRYAPLQIMTDVDDIEAGSRTTCALGVDGAVWCWGWNKLGQTGSVPTTGDPFAHEPSPVQVPGVVDAVDVAVGATSACAVLRDGGVSCWGDGMPPSPVAGVGGAVEVSVGAQHACALTQVGEVLCWGNGTHGELGDGSYESSAGAVRAELGAAAVSVGAGQYETCAATVDGAVLCWGRVGPDS
jgi:alpha-tubulin suppressor-like RCC1 family protein